jgi:SAM-dependent methyltransferase
MTTMPRDIFCPICSSKETVHKFYLKPVTIRACRDCGHRFQYPPPSENLLDSIFAGLYNGDLRIIREYFPEWEGFYTGRKEDLNTTRCSEILQRRLCLAERFIDPGELLDIGCGFGQFLQLARDRGWKIGGVETSPPAAAYVEAELGLEVEKTIPDDLSSYRLLTMWDVLEHQSAPREFLEKLSRSARPGAVLAITVPNRNCLLTWLAELFWIISRGRIRTPLGKFYFITHLQYFSRTGICALLESAGFQILLTSGENTCLENLDLGWVMKATLRVLFALNGLFGARNRLLVYARLVSLPSAPSRQYSNTPG